ncbi:hypothetical protein [Polycladidibacter hongkongensis]|uniref:hypothetical protein n=1 Tax=Polycladidibacter hongkongensis TaxID=1647556 RepID=UPI0008336B3C|nr:hypothetical protein [Pseudovibrio hongkongensis]
MLKEYKNSPAPVKLIYWLFVLFFCALALLGMSTVLLTFGVLTKNFFSIESFEVSMATFAQVLSAVATLTLAILGYRTISSGERQFRTIQDQQRNFILSKLPHDINLLLSCLYTIEDRYIWYIYGQRNYERIEYPKTSIEALCEYAKFPSPDAAAVSNLIAQITSIFPTIYWRSLNIYSVKCYFPEFNPEQELIEAVHCELLIQLLHQLLHNATPLDLRISGRDMLERQYKFHICRQTLPSKDKEKEHLERLFNSNEFTKLASELDGAIKAAKAVSPP